jgi:protein-S-isoprenylcysteine O-methyltransferase Ste14
MKKILPPTMFLFCLIGMLLLHWIIPLASMDSSMLVIAGLGFILLGLGIAITAEAQFKRVGTNVNTFGLPIKLVTDGWFKYSRNPMYLGFAIVLAGAWLVLGSVSSALGLLAFVIVADRWYIAYEERRLEEIFGPAYEMYRNRTRRWL